MINPDDVFQPSEDVISRKFDDEIVLIDLNSEEIYELNKTGARFWELLGEGKRIDQIEVELRNEYDISIEELETELESIITQLLERGLIYHVK